MLTRELSLREKTLLVVLAVLILVMAYVKLFLQPMNDRYDAVQMDIAGAQEEEALLTAREAEILRMEKKLEEIKADPGAKVMPLFDNVGPLMTGLNRILEKTVGFSISFDALSYREHTAVRTLHITMTTNSYAEAAQIIRSMHQEDTVMSLSNLSVTEDKGVCSVSMLVSYYEMVNN